jgi:hypothetical protein
VLNSHIEKEGSNAKSRQDDHARRDEGDESEADEDEGAREVEEKEDVAAAESEPEYETDDGDAVDECTS